MPKTPPKYAESVCWIALNDDPEEMRPEMLADTLTVLLVADVFEQDAAKVARDVVRARTVIAEKRKTS